MEAVCSGSRDTIVSPPTMSLRGAGTAARHNIPRDARIPRAPLLSFRSFNNQYTGRTCYVIGRGPTSFDYTKLASVSDPIFFINDAVCMEQYAVSETFFFAHDIELRVWFDGSMKSTAVIPGDASVLGEPHGRVLGHRAPAVFYERAAETRWDLLKLNRDQIAERGQLFTLAGTIHSLLHFVWFCGFRRVVLIGCDGINQKQELVRAGSTPSGYDPRLQNRSQSAPLWKYLQIRQAQDLLITLFGLEAAYLGTPVP